MNRDNSMKCCVVSEPDSKTFNVTRPDYLQSEQSGSETSAEYVYSLVPRDSLLFNSAVAIFDMRPAIYAYIHRIAHVHML